jgi:hypothetical protein
MRRFLVPILLALAGFASARDTAAQLRSVDKDLLQNESAQAYYKNVLDTSKDLIYVQIKGANGKSSVISVDKKTFKDWAASEILSGSMTPSDITAIVSMSSDAKRTVKLVAQHRLELLREGEQRLREQQRALAHKLEQERNGRSEPPSNSASFVGEWIGTSGKGGFREEWSIAGSDNSYQVTIHYYRNNVKVGEAGGAGSVHNGKLRFRAVTSLKPDPSWSDAVDMVVTVHENVLIFDYSTGSASGTVSLNRKQ